MISQVFAGSSLVYDPRVDGMEMLSLSVHARILCGGSASFQMPITHPYYNSFVGLKTIVLIYRGSELIFRGRALVPSDDLNGTRTITCESERCFFNDAVLRPYDYRASPETIFRDIIAVYNSQVDEEKRFSVGSVTVTDNNDYIRLSSESPRKVSDAINDLLDRCGGYIVFSGDPSSRIVNWYAELTHYSTQKIKLGDNLLDFSRQDADISELATVLIPYGAKIGDTGKRITIESVNNGIDYIEAADAIAYRGRIVKSKIWDDVTKPENLLSKAIAHLSKAKMVTTRLSISAIDLSAMDQSIDTFSVGDLVPVQIEPYGVDDDFVLFERDYDLMNAANDTITIGSALETLTGLSGASERKNSDTINRIYRESREEYDLNKALISETETRLLSLIQQTSSDIMLEVDKTKEDADGIKEQIAQINVNAENVGIRVSKIETDGVDKVKTSIGYTLSDDGLHIQKSGEEIDNSIDNTGMYVKRGDDVMLQANKDGVIATDVTVRNYLIIGSHARFEDYSDGTNGNRTACFYIGGGN